MASCNAGGLMSGVSIQRTCDITTSAGARARYRGVCAVYEDAALYYNGNRPLVSWPIVGIDVFVDFVSCRKMVVESSNFTTAHAIPRDAPYSVQGRPSSYIRRNTRQQNVPMAPAVCSVLTFNVGEYYQIQQLVSPIDHEYSPRIYQVARVVSSYFTCLNIPLLLLGYTGSGTK